MFHSDVGFRDAKGPLHAWDEAGESRDACTILSQRAAVGIKSVPLKVFIRVG